MTSKLPSHLMINRHGIFYLRLTKNGRERRKSLRTRDPIEAKKAAFSLGYRLAIMKKSHQDSDHPELDHFNGEETELIDAGNELLHRRFLNGPVNEILEEEAFQRGVKNHKAQQRAYARLEALKDKNDEDAYFELLLKQNSHIKQPIVATQPQEVVLAC